MTQSGAGKGKYARGLLLKRRGQEVGKQIFRNAVKRPMPSSPLQGIANLTSPYPIGYISIARGVSLLLCRTGRVIQPPRYVASKMRVVTNPMRFAQ